jgi:tRNA dimethylallyltransferase
VSSVPFVPSLIGATASGKTGVALAVARRVGAEIVSADSRQVYRGLEIGTAKPTGQERAAVPHHLVDVAGPTERFSAARFGREARAAIEDIRERGKLPLLVGGSGLYLRAAEEGLFEGPEADPALRERLRAEAEEEGRPALHARLAAVDPETAKRLHPNDHVRVIRALEVHELTGVPLSEHHRRHREETPPVRPLRFGLQWPVLVLDRRIERRVDAMLEAGWEDEVRRLVEGGLAEAPALETSLGYPEMRELVEGRIDRATARERIVLATRQFAKRQRTWFRAVEGVTWIRLRGPEDLKGAVDTVAEGIEAAMAGR